MIYLILSAGFKDNNPDQFERRLKIGYTDNLENRLKAYLTTNPDFMLLQTREGDTIIESYLHKKFEKYKYKDSKEWFYYNQEIIDYFQDEVEDFIDEGILLECIKKDLRSKIASVSELKEKYLNQILDEIKSLDEFDEELYDEEAITRVILDTWILGINLFNKAIDNIELVNYQPIDLLKIDNPEITVDITLDLPQILGRQRLDCNPWKNRAELYVRFLSNKNYKKVDDFKKHQNLKITRTEKLLSIYNSSTDNDAKHELAKTYLYVAKSKNYKDDYVAVNTHGGSDLIPVFNNLVMVSEFRAFEIQQIDYVDRFRTFSKIQSSEFDLDPSVDIVNNFVNNFNSFTQFPDKMRLLCESKLSETILNAVLSQVPLIYSTLYYSVGPEKMKSLRYRKGEIEDYYKSTALYESNLLLEKINSNFKVGDRLSSIDIKHKLSEIYKELNLMKTAKATDLEKFFLLKDIKIPSTRDGESIRLRGYELLSKKEN